MTRAELRAVLTWCLSAIPQDPPEKDMGGWTNGMREEWERNRERVVDLLVELEPAQGVDEREIQRLCATCLSPDHSEVMCGWRDG